MAKVKKDTSESQNHHKEFEGKRYLNNKEIHMPSKHRDNSNRLNLERNDLDRQGQGRGERPIVDRGLEKEADWAARTHVRGVHYGKGPKGFRRSDERIKEEVCQALFDSYDVDASNIEVEVKDGCVYLKGEVDDRMTKRLAEDTVENLDGVKDIQNMLTFKREPKIKRNISRPEDEFGTRLS